MIFRYVVDPDSQHRGSVFTEYQFTVRADLQDALVLHVLPALIQQCDFQRHETERGAHAMTPMYIHTHMDPYTQT